MAIRRRKLLLTAVAAALIVLVGGWLGNIIRVKYLESSKGLWRRNNIYVYQRQRIEADLLFIGTSRTLAGISARIVEDELSDRSQETEAFNLGQVGVGGVSYSIVLGDVVRSNGCPGLVVVEVGPGTINRDLGFTRAASEHASPRNWPVLLPPRSLAQLDALLAGNMAGLIGISRQLAQPPSVEHTARIERRAGSRWGDVRPRTYPRLSKAKLARALERGERRVRRRFRTFELGGPPQRGLEATLDTAVGCGAKAILVRLPSLVSTTKLEPHDVEEEFLAYVRSLSATRGIPFHDIDRTTVGLEIRDYMDHQHLNYTGAEKLSRYLAREILWPYFDEPVGI